MHSNSLLVQITSEYSMALIILMLTLPGLDPQTAFVGTEGGLRIQFDRFDGLRGGHEVKVSDDGHQSNLGLKQGEPHGQTAPGALSESQKCVPESKND